jgi:hypothetical protein
MLASPGLGNLTFIRFSGNEIPALFCAIARIYGYRKLNLHLFFRKSKSALFYAIARIYGLMIVYAN